MRPLAAESGTHRPALPRVLVQARLWLWSNLFGSVGNTVLTLAAVAALAAIVPPVFTWTLSNAVWGAQPAAACAGIDGACWAFLHEKHRLILFGRYPFDEQWRPLAATALLIALLAASAIPQLWRRWLSAAWISGLLAGGALMWGGVFGLAAVPTKLWGGLPLTLMLSVVGIALAFPFALVLALGRRSTLPMFRAAAVAYIELIRGVPLISLLFMASFMLPLFLPGGVTVNELLRAQVAIALFTAAYLAEVIRGGLQGVPRGQYEAAQALGLGYWRAMAFVVLPQALRLVIPAMVNTFIGTFKDTSLVAIVSLTDLLLATRQAIADPLWRPYFLEGYVVIALIYFGFCFSMSRYSVFLERKLRTR
ncbi:MAG: amino acid ABC transporter permease [Alphaproteobacteria bacterium]|nr:amino acid ABC transporter permease [Alphaproteobacteria bacterium]